MWMRIDGASSCLASRGYYVCATKWFPVYWRCNCNKCRIILKVGLSGDREITVTSTCFVQIQALNQIGINDQFHQIINTTIDQTCLTTTTNDWQRTIKTKMHEMFLIGSTSNPCEFGVSVPSGKSSPISYVPYLLSYPVPCSTNLNHNHTLYHPLRTYMPTLYPDGSAYLS